MEYQPDADIEPLLRSILTSHFPGRSVTGIRVVGNGSNNAVYGATVSGLDVVLRLADARYRAGEHAKEAWCIERAEAAGIPVPKVLAVGRQDRTVYMVQEFVRGLRGDDAAVDQIEVWHTLGQYARLIHGIDASDFCDHDDENEGWAERKWARYVAYGLESLTPDDALIALGVYAPEQQPAIRAVFEGLKRQSFRGGLTHGDLSVWNTIVEEDGRIKLFDWGCASVGLVPHIEMSSILRWLRPDDAHFQAFLAGYGLSPLEFAAILPQIVDFEMLNAFDLVRWCLDRRPDQLDSYVARAQQKNRFNQIGQPQSGITLSHCET